MKKMKTMDLIAVILLIIGGLNWGLVGLLEFDLVATLFGDMTLISRIVYILVGISAIYAIFLLMEKKGKREMLEK